MEFGKPDPAGGEDPAGRSDRSPAASSEEDWSTSGPGVLPNPEARLSSPHHHPASTEYAPEPHVAGPGPSRKAFAATAKLREFGASAVIDQKQRAAAEIGSVSSALRRVADNLRSDRDHHLGEYAESAAEQLDRVERYLRERSLERMYTDLQTFGRRRPEMLVGGLFVAGVALARFLKASRPSPMASSPADAAGADLSAVGEPVLPPFRVSPPGAEHTGRITTTDHAPEGK